MPALALSKSSTLVDDAAWAPASIPPLLNVSIYQAEQTESQTLFFCRKERLSTPALPPEILEIIAGYLMQLIPPASHDNDSFCARKPLWSNVQGFMQASVALHQMGFVRWVRVLKVHSHEDWGRILKLSHLVQELDCEDGAFGKGVSRSILARFPRLHTISIDAHGEITRGEANQLSYRSLFRELPSSLLRFEITHAHGPDLKVVETLKTFCPNLEVLRLGKCTMFNRTPACDFWARHPFDHAAYISVAGTDDYARSVAQELSAFQKLESLRLGAYFIPLVTVLAHRAYHVRGMVAPLQLTWRRALTDLLNLSQTESPQEPELSQLISLYHKVSETNFGPDTCSFCRDLALQGSKEAERAANVILDGLVPSLRRIEWMSWFTPSHVGVSPYLMNPVSTSLATGSTA